MALRDERLLRTKGNGEYAGKLGTEYSDWHTGP
jgi:hypothetical protein